MFGDRAVTAPPELIGKSGRPSKKGTVCLLDLNPGFRCWNHLFSEFMEGVERVERRGVGSYSMDVIKRDDSCHDFEVGCLLL